MVHNVVSQSRVESSLAHEMLRLTGVKLNRSLLLSLRESEIVVYI